MSAKAKPPRTRLPPDQRKAQLLRCAISAFAEYGIARATHAHVAERAQVSVSAVHSYFRTREDLVAATLGEVEATLMEIALNKSLEKASVHEALWLMAHSFDRAVRDDPDVIKVWLDWSTGFRADVWPGYLRMQERLHNAVQKILARGKRLGLLSEALNAKAASRLFIGGGHTVALMRFAGASQREIEILMDHLICGTTSIGLAPVSDASQPSLLTTS